MPQELLHKYDLDVFVDVVKAIKEATTEVMGVTETFASDYYLFSPPPPKKNNIRSQLLLL